MNTYHVETSLLGSILLDDSLFPNLLIDEAYFVYPEHQLIFQAMKTTYEENQALDTVLLTSELMRLNKLEEAGGVSYLTKLAASVPTTAHFRNYEAFLQEQFQLRKAKEMISKFLNQPTEQQLNLLMTDLQTLLETTSPKKLKSTFDHLVELSEEILEPKEAALGMMTSLKPFDDITGGLQRGELIILAARPSVGKTAFALNLAAGHCDNGGTSLIFSLEMKTKQLLKRMISKEARVNLGKWRDIFHLFTAKDYERALQAIGMIAEWKLEIDAETTSLREICRSIRTYTHKHPNENPIVIIDYLQLIRPHLMRKERRDLEIGEITRELKLLALELNIPIVLLSQLSRSVEKRQDKRPVMADLRESGNIEQDADVVAFLYREDYYDRETVHQHELEVIFAKQRNGPTDTVKMNFWKAFGLVGN